MPRHHARQPTPQGQNMTNLVTQTDRPYELVRSHAYGYGGGYAKLADYTTPPSPSDEDGTENEKKPSTAQP
jgi:hypothetical protein